MQETIQCPVRISDEYGANFIGTFKHNQEELGQYFTPYEISEYMASLVELPPLDTIKILDPGAGSGVLVASLVKHLINSNGSQNKTFYVVLYEVDSALIETLTDSMIFLKRWCELNNSIFTFLIKNEDYVLANGSQLNVNNSFIAGELFDIVISNPPYFKISKDDPRAKACKRLVFGQPNIYSLFMGVAVSQLKENGQFVFITPRSFTSGQYFKAFRKYFFENISLKRIHVFESRTDSFDRDSVLQENIICAGKKNKISECYPIVISSSAGRRDLDKSEELNLNSNIVIDSSNDDNVCLPANHRDLLILDTIKSWDNSLAKMGLKISTGPVVPFRATEFLKSEDTNESVPLLWIQHVLPMTIKFPLSPFRKQQWFLSNEESKKLLVENQNMILMRRFSPKEDFRRLTVAPYTANFLEYNYLGLENHLNYIYSPTKGFEASVMFGLAAFLNSKFFDSYFRITNGNTQVSATELKTATLPSLDMIKAIGSMIIDGGILEHSSIDKIVDEILDIKGMQH